MDAHHQNLSRLLEPLRTVLEAAHSYELPEVLAFPVVDGSPNYLAWMDGELPPETPVNKIQALIFDMDGVIVDSNPVHREAWAEYNRRQGIETTEAMQRRMYGKRNDKIIRDFFGCAHYEEVFAHGADKEALYREMLAPSPS